MRVEIWSDVVCPWCYIGKRKFEAALASYQGDETFEIVWRPFQLDPTAPKGTAQPVKQVYEKKFGGPERAASIIEHVSSVAAGVGLDFDMDRAVRANTMDAHRLIGPGAQDPELFLRAFQRMADLKASEASEASEAEGDAAMLEGDAEACRADARPES